MNKMIALIIMATTALSSNAMDTMQITEDQKIAFCRHLNMAAMSCKGMVQAGEISEKNSIYFVLSQMSGILAESKGDVGIMINKMGLRDDINNYKQVDLNPLIKFGLEQVRSQSGDVKAAADYVRKTRNLISGTMLQIRQPSYSPSFIGEVQTKDRIDFMKRNETFSLEEEAVKGYAALFIYQLVFASQVQ